MTRVELLSKVQKLLDGHLRRILGSMYQDPYKSDFFELFREDYVQGFSDVASHTRLTGDGLHDIMVERWIHPLQNPDLQKQAATHLETLTTMWQEWQYACDMWPVPLTDTSH